MKWKDNIKTRLNEVSCKFVSCFRAETNCKLLCDGAEPSGNQFSKLDSKVKMRLTHIRSFHVQIPDGLHLL